MGLIDIVFQSGEIVKENDDLNWIELTINGLIAIVAALAGGGVAWLIAKDQVNSAEKARERDLLKTKKEERDKEIQRIDERLSYFKWLIPRIINLTDVLASNYLELSDNMIANDLGTHQLPIRNLADLERIQSINLEEVFTSIIRKHGTDEKFLEPVRKAISNIDNVILILKEIPKQFEGMHIDIRELKIRYRDHITIINSTFNKTLHELRIDPNNNFRANPLWYYLNDRLLYYNTKIPNNADVDWVNKNYLYPTQEHLGNNFIDHEKTQDALQNGKSALLIAGQIKFSTYSMAEQLKSNAEFMKKTVDALNSNLKDLIII